MANAILAFGNRIDSATLSGGSWLSTLPLANLKDRRLGAVARSSNADLASTKFDIDLTGARRLRIIALVRHNFSLAAQYRITLSAAADFSSPVHDSGWVDVWPIIYPSGTLPWGSPSWWTGRPSIEEIESYSNRTLACILPRSLNARYVRVEISDPDNSLGYVELGRVFLADGWQPVRNMVYGASLAWEDKSDVQEALSLAEFFGERPQYRVARIAFENMTEDEAMATAFEIQRQVGVTREVFFVWNPADTVHALRRQFLARLRTLSAIENPGPDRWRAPFEIKELL